SGGAAGSSSRNRQNGRPSSGNSSRGGQNTARPLTSLGTPDTSSGAICVPSSERTSRPASVATSRTTSDLPAPGGESKSTLSESARQRTSSFACDSVTFGVMKTPARFTTETQRAQSRQEIKGELDGITGWTRFLIEFILLSCPNSSPLCPPDF